MNGIFVESSFSASRHGSPALPSTAPMTLPHIFIVSASSNGKSGLNAGSVYVYAFRWYSVVLYISSKPCAVGIE